MKSWKGYTVLDLLLISIGLLVVTTASILCHSKWYIILNTILGLLCVFTQAKGKVITQFLGVIWFCFYISISYSQKYYGEALLYLTIMLPMYIYGVIHWLKNRDSDEKDTVIVRNNLSKKEWLLASVGFVILSIIICFVLKALGTSKLEINILSFITMLPAVYLLIRRCKWNQVAFLFNDFVAPFLWILLVAEGNKIFLPMCIYHMFQITYDVYGLIEWIKLEKIQSNS